jgi:hypothetical protein
MVQQHCRVVKTSSSCWTDNIVRHLGCSKDTWNPGKSGNPGKSREICWKARKSMKTFAARNKIIIAQSAEKIDQNFFKK